MPHHSGVMFAMLFIIIIVVIFSLPNCTAFKE